MGSAISIKLAVAGVSGRMGGALIAEVSNSEQFELTGAIHREGSALVGLDAGISAGVKPLQVPIVGSVEQSEFDVLVDFTLPEPSLANIQYCADQHKAIVIGTTGYSGQQLQQISLHAQKIPIVLAPNMSVGVNVTFHLLQQAAKVIGDSADVEIIETHHRNKLDAPSGTALRMGEVIAGTLGKNLDDCAVFDRGTGPGSVREQRSIGFSSVRAGDVIGDHTVIFALAGERIEIEHKATNRSIYAAGALRAAQWLEGKPAGLYDMQDVLGLRS